MVKKNSNEDLRKGGIEALRQEMEVAANRIRELVLSLPPHDLLGYIFAQHIKAAMAQIGNDHDQEQSDGVKDLLNQNQFLLEYVHAVLASHTEPVKVSFDEAKCAELFEQSEKLRQQALLFAVVSSVDTKDGAFGPDTADVEFRAKCTWVILRGNRYQVLEGEFYRYVLAPHDEVLKEVYGASANEIADGFQAMADAMRTGHATAIAEMTKQMEAVKAFAASQSKPLSEAMKGWINANADQAKAARYAMDDIVRGGIANVTRHTKLPSALLADLAYQRGEETEFFSAGEFSGTPYRTLPARKKPLIQLGTDYYAVDPCFTRDAGYRALLYNLLVRMPSYKQDFKDRQKKMSELAFADILSSQLPGAKIFHEVYYKDTANKEWAENDTLILIDDVLILVEAKAGAAATIASPALDFGRHAQSVQDLVIKAYKQCDRFFSYISSKDEVPLYSLVKGKYEECGRIRRADYRVMLPIGLTVESFSPFSAYCKELPVVEPLLGSHPFISMSIDDLFVLKRFLATPGEFAHYMEVRQAVAGMRRAHIFDEFDHLGAYLTKNRFDLEIADQLANDNANLVVWDGMCSVVDKHFEGENWALNPVPKQDYPEEVLLLLAALDGTREKGWLSAESSIRDLCTDSRNDLAKYLGKLRLSLHKYPARHFLLGGKIIPLFVWLQKHGQEIDWKKVHDKASASALAVNATSVVCVVAIGTADGAYQRAYRLDVSVPKIKTKENEHVFEDAARLSSPDRVVKLQPSEPLARPVGLKKPGRNDPCPCGSGTKYKKCHGNYMGSERW